MKRFFLSMLLTACGGAPFELVDTTADDAGFVDETMQEAADVSDASDERAQKAHEHDASDERVQDASATSSDAADAVDAPDERDASQPSTTLCCSRPNGNAVCADQPWWCCATESCSSVANCGAVYPNDGGNACAQAVGAKCGLFGGPSSGVVGPC